MRFEKIAIPERHIECEFCIAQGINYFCTANSNEKFLIENPTVKIDLSVCPLWGRIEMKYRTN